MSTSARFVNLRRALEALPAPLLALAVRLTKRPGFAGDYPTFEAAASASRGYDLPEVARAVAKRLPTTDVERKAQICRPFEQIRLESGSSHAVLDVGGANGGAYRTLRAEIPSLALDWTVLETPSMVAANSGESGLRFVTEAPESNFDVVYMSGVLQYLPNPYAALASLATRGRYIVLDRVPLIERDRITVQTVRTSDYSTSYPCWFFDRRRFLAAVESVGRVSLKWDVPQDRPLLDGRRVPFCGMLIHRGIRLHHNGD